MGAIFFKMVNGGVRKIITPSYKRGGFIKPARCPCRPYIYTSEKLPISSCKVIRCDDDAAIKNFPGNRTKKPEM